MQTEQPPQTEDNPSPLAAIPRPYLLAALGVAGLLLIVGLVGAGLSLRQPVDTPASQSANSAAATARTATPTTLPTELPPPNAAAQAEVTERAPLPEPTATVLPAALPLPTVTPTPELPPAAPRDVVISGSTTMRLALSGEGFDSTGRPLSFEIQPRTATLGGETVGAPDAWCVQLGLVHEAFDLTMSLEPGTENLLVYWNHRAAERDSASSRARKWTASTSVSQCRPTPLVRSPTTCAARAAYSV